MTRYPLVLLVFLILIYSSFTILKAEDKFDSTEPSQNAENISSYFSDLEDEAHAYTRGDLLKLYDLGKFKKKSFDGVSLNFGYSDSVHWLHILIENQSSGPIERLIEIRASRIAHLDFHEFGSNGKINSIYTGSALAFQTRAYKNRFFVFPIHIPANSQKHIFFRLESSASLIFQAMLWTPVTFAIYERNDYFAQAWYFGMATAMILFNLLLFLTLRDIIYLIYVSFVVTIALSLGTSNGLVKEYIWQTSSELYNMSSSAGFSLTFIIAIFFMRRMISTGKIVPRLDRVMWGFVLLHILYIMLSIFFYPSIGRIAPVLFIFTMVFLMGTGIYCAFLKQRAAYFFVIAFILLFITGVLNGLTNLGILPAPSIRDNALQFGSAGEMILLAFALADRYKIIQREKQNAQNDLLRSQKKTLVAEQKLVETLKISEKNLEQRVMERTQELDHMLKILQHDLSVAKKIQENSLYVNPNLHKELNIVKTYLPISEVGGDFYDICNPKPYLYRIFQADATGHGVQAAMITMAIKGVYDNVKTIDNETGKILETFNHQFIDKYSSLQSLMTGILIDIDVKSKKIKYSSAGHPPAILLNEEGTHFLKTPGRIIGVDLAAIYQTREVFFKPGDRLYIITDGVFEEFNLRLEEFGEERFYSILKNNRNLSIQETIDLAIEQLSEFLDGVEKQDDFTILGIEYNCSDENKEV